MSHERPDWPVAPRPYIAYRPPPAPQPARSRALREVWADTRRFLERVAKPYSDSGKVIHLELQRWTAETTAATKRRLGEWPAACTTADFEAAERLAHERFGTPRHEATGARAAWRGLESMRLWHVPVERADEVLDFIEGVPTCMGGVEAPVRASYSVLFELRDLTTGKLLPDQGPRHHPMRSWLSVELQRHSTVMLGLILPFAEPDEAAADYVVALQAYIPVWLDPRYFDHGTPAVDGASYRRLRLPPDWIGRTPDGELRLDASRSGITPREPDLPTPAEIASHDPRRSDGAMRVHVAAVRAALRDDAQAALVIRGPFGSSTDWLAERAAYEAGLPVRRVGDAARIPRRSIAPALRTFLAECGEAAAVLLLEDDHRTTPKVREQLRRLVATRALGTVRLPGKLRLVLLERPEPGEATQAAMVRAGEAQTEGFATREQLRYLHRRAIEAANAEITVTLGVIPGPSHS